MSDAGDRFWQMAGVSEVQDSDGTKRVRIPDRLFKDEDILEVGEDVRWYLDTVTNVIVVSKYFLEDDEYESVDSTSFTKGDSTYRCTVPKKLFEGYEGRGSPKANPEVAEKVSLPEEEWLVFMYHQGMAESDTKSAYVMTQSQYSDRFDDSDLSGIPKFQ